MNGLQIFGRLITRIAYCALSICLLVFSLSTMPVPSVEAISINTSDWVRPHRIPSYEPTSAPPILIADQDRTVHAFSSQWLQNQFVIMYRQWSVERGWTLPVDIILPVITQEARLTSVVLDEEGIFHMVFFSGDDFWANIYYTQAPAVDAGRASAWSKPVNIGRNAITPTLARLALLRSGELVMVYSSRLQGQGLYVSYSFDKGESWSLPDPLFLTYDHGLWPTPLELYEDSNGRLHALWGLVDLSGNSQAIYYAQLDDPLKQWSTAVLFAEAIGFEADTPAIVEHDGQLIVVYHNDFPTTRWMRRSFDGGDTWTDPVRLFAHVGSNGAAAFVKNSDNVLHMFFGNRVGNPAIHGMWHTTWQVDEQRWREPEPVVSGPRVTGPLGGAGFDPSFARVVALQGNILLLTWVTDPGAGQNGVWYTYTQLDAPAWPRQPLPEPTLVPTPTSLPDEDAFLVDIPGIEVDPDTEEKIYEPVESGYAQILLASTLPAGLFVILVLGIFSFRMRKRK
jgi:hypothetical protein